MSKLFVRKALPAAVLLAATHFAQAQSVALEEVIVTAQKRVQSLQDTPLSVAALGVEQLENQGIRSLADLTIQSPSLQSYDFPTSTSNIAMFLRGFGNTDSQTLTIDNPVGVYIDGVYVARTSSATMSVLDLERVEILRGPQGTIFGRNSAAGAISFITEKPAEEFGVKLQAGGGSEGLIRGGATVDMPITDTLRSRLTVFGMEEDGWVENSGPNSTNGQDSEDFYARSETGVRVALAWDATDSISVDYSYDWTDLDGAPPYYQVNDNDRREDTTHLFLGNTDFKYVLPDDNNNEQKGHNLTVTWELSESMTLKSITGYREMDERSIQNWSDTLFFATDLDWSTDAFSQEVQLLGSLFDGEVDYITGVYYFDEDGDKFETQYTNGVSGAFDALLEPLASTSVGVGGNNLGANTIETDLESTAFFAQTTYTPEALDSRLGLTVGVRYTDDDRSAERALDESNPSLQFPAGENDDDYNRWDYNVSVDYALTDNMNIYGRVATGFRSGGSAERALDFSQTFDEEEATSYELGLKGEFWDSRVRVNAAYFQTDYDDLLLTISGQSQAFASFVEIFNAGEADIDGFELDVTALVTDSTTVSVNYAYLDTELSDVVVPQESFLLAGPPASTDDLRGQDITDNTFIPYAPEHAFTIAVDQGFDLGFAQMNVHVNYAYRDELFSSPRGGLPVDELGLLNSRITVSGFEVAGAQLEVALWGKNLTDTEEVVYNLSNLGYQYNRPTSWGLDLRAEF